MADTPDHPFRRRSNGSSTGRRNGASPRGMGTRPIPMDDVPSEPLDLVAVQADDELISALAAGLQVSAPGRGGYDADDHVAAMLAAWKADIDADPVPEIDLDKAVGAALAGRRPSGRLRHLVPVASAAALIVVAITGVSIAAHDTRPGDPLFSVSKVLYAEEATSYEALATVEQSRERAKQALAVGDKEAAAAALAEGQAAAEKVLAEHGRGEVEQRLHKLEVVVEDTEPGVPTFVEDEDEPSSGGGSPDENQPGATNPSTTSSQEPSSAASSADPRSSGDEPGTQEPGTQDPGSSGDPRPDPRSSAGSQSGSSGGPGTDGPGTSDPGTSDPGTSEPGTSEPAPDTQQPDSPAGEASKPAAQPNVEDDPSSEPSEPQPSAEPSAAEPTSSPTTGKPPVTREGSSGSSGISGASMSATGTATPSGEPTT